MLLVLLYQCLAGLLAWWNFVLIRHNRRIYHALNGSLHLAAAITIGYYTGWNYGVSCLLFTRVVFDTVLNVLRSNGVGYISPNPLSWLDKQEKALVLWLAAIIYRKRRIIKDEDIEWVAIGIRVIILGLATGSLFI
jgi:hypothetical protein